MNNDPATGFLEDSAMKMKPFVTWAGFEGCFAFPQRDYSRKVVRQPFQADESGWKA